MQGTELPEPHAPTPVYVGIDVCKAWLDVHLHPLGHGLRVQNDHIGLRRLKRALAPLQVVLIVMEATGKYHRHAHRTLAAAGLAVAVVNPLRARLFAEAAGALAKTDRLDARLLALMAEGLGPSARAPMPAALVELQELARARQAAVGETVALRNRLGASELGFLKRELSRRLASLKAHLARLEAEIQRRIKAEPSLHRRYLILTSIPGIGPLSALSLLVDLAELGNCSGRAASLLAGLAPLADDSGKNSGQRRIRGGRASVRCALYMAALAAARHNPDLAAFYKRLREAGKKPKIALTAVMRKLVVLANTLISQDRLWQRQPPIRA